MRRLFVLFTLTLVPIVMHAQSVLTFDRGLPTCNLNNAAGSFRINVAWSFGNDWITGDDFVLGVAGETYVITKIRGWTINGLPDDNTVQMGDRFQTVTLYGAKEGDPLAALATGDLVPDSDTNSNPAITHTKVTYDSLDEPHYQAPSGAYIQIWQTDFDLVWPVMGGQKYLFAADGVLHDGESYNWFNHASSNEQKKCGTGGTAGMDGFFLGWDKTDLATPYPWDSDDDADGGWDKSSDINVQVWAELLGDGMSTGGGWFIPETASSIGIVTGDESKANFGFVARSKKSVASGNLEFQYHEPSSGINLKSSTLTSVKVMTSQVIFEGEGTLNGVGSHRFRVRAVDGDKLGGGVSDRFEITIWTTGGTFESPYYRAYGDLGGGQIVVHKK